MAFPILTPSDRYEVNMGDATYRYDSLLSGNTVVLATPITAIRYLYLVQFKFRSLV